MTGLASAGGKAAITIPQNWVLVFEFGELKRKRKNPKDVWNMEARPNSTCPNLSKNSTSKPQTLNVLNDKTLQLPSGRAAARSFQIFWPLPGPRSEGCLRLWGVSCGLGW